MDIVLLVRHTKGFAGTPFNSQLQHSFLGNSPEVQLDRTSMVDSGCIPTTKQHGRQQPPQLRLAPQELHPNILTQHGHSTYCKCVCPFPLQILEVPARSKFQKIRGPKSGTLSAHWPHWPAAQCQPAASTSRSSTVDSNVRSPLSRCPAAAPQHSDTAWTQHLNVFALRLCKSSTCRQHLNAEDDSGPLICSLHCSSMSASNLNIPKQHGRQQRPQLLLAAQQLHPNILTQHGHST